MSFDRTGLATAIARHGAVIRVVVAATRGSAPREAGASMLVWPSGQAGTIGGGALEHAAATDARDRLASGAAGPWLQRHALGPDLGQCCGGAVWLAAERWDAEALAARPSGVAPRPVAAEAEAAPPWALRRAAGLVRRGVPPALPLLSGGWLLEAERAAERVVWLWGAGHVGRAIAGVLAPLPGLSLSWIDTAPERFPDPLPDGVTAIPAAAPAALARLAPPEAEHLVLTYSHALDLEICHALLGRPFRSLGLIGSATKRARFHRRLSALGHSDAQIARIICPIGAPGMGKHPQAIAVGVAADLLSADHRGHAMRNEAG